MYLLLKLVVLFRSMRGGMLPKPRNVYLGQQERTQASSADRRNDAKSIISFNNTALVTWCVSFVCRLLVASLSGHIANSVGRVPCLHSMVRFDHLPLRPLLWLGLHLAAYISSEAAERQLCRSLRAEWGGFGIRLNTGDGGVCRNVEFTNKSQICIAEPSPSSECGIHSALDAVARTASDLGR